MKSIAKKITVIAIGLILLVAIVAGGFFAAMLHHFHPSAPQLHLPPAATTLEAQRQDIRYFRQLMAMDRSFAPADRAKANRRLDALQALDIVLDRPHFRVSLMQIDALTDNGHSRVENDLRAAPLERNDLLASHAKTTLARPAIVNGATDATTRTGLYASGDWSFFSR